MHDCTVDAGTLLSRRLSGGRNVSARASFSLHQSNQDKYAMFRPLLAAAAIAAVSIAPAEARHIKRHQHTWSGTAGRLAFPGDYAHYGRDPYGVYVGGQEVGRDPDPNVRQRMLSDYDYLYSW
jgi:hypothetical protein